MSFENAKITFQNETEELLQDMEDALLALEQDPTDANHINRVFRAVHTIKGSAGIFGFQGLVAFAHTLETELDHVRNGTRAVDPELVATLLGCKDHLIELTGIAVSNAQGLDGPELKATSAALLARLGPTQTAPLSSVAEATAAVRKTGQPPSGKHWLIQLNFHPDALRNGMDPISFLRYLQGKGEIVDVIIDPSRFPSAAEMDPESCYLSLQIGFVGEVGKEDLYRVFEFAEDDCDIRILPPDSNQAQYLAQLEDLPEEQTLRLGEMLVRIGCLTQAELDRTLNRQQSDAGQGQDKRLGEILVAEERIQGPLVQAALNKQAKTRERTAQESRFIRVDSEKLGHLINLVGELVIGNAAMKLAVEDQGHGDLEDVVYSMDQLIEGIRDTALQLRMVQIGDTFSRFRRVVRDVSQEIGKQIELTITGGETELDKTIVERLNDPLMHLVRNAMDHGIEPPEERLAAGKPACGQVLLDAYHESGHIVIRIADDGRGLDADKIRAKAIAKGLIGPDQTLSRSEIFRLIFAAGLSTKQEVTDLSGRGVGMDVVLSNIEALRGTVELDSTMGRGTTITIHLPLTLAIIDGFQVGAGQESYVIPLSQVEECIEVDTDELLTDHRRHYINLRGSVLPYLHLGDFFGCPRSEKAAERESMVVVRFGRQRAGLVVDRLYGELQTVIKPMGKVFANLDGISGATVLGSGDIALILDIQGLIKCASGSLGTRPHGNEALLDRPKARLSA